MDKNTLQENTFTLVSEVDKSLRGSLHIKNSQYTIIYGPIPIAHVDMESLVS